MSAFRTKCLVAALGVALTPVFSQAQIISLNFSENSANQGFAGGEMIGPLMTDSANWNNTNDYGGPLEAGTMTNLIDTAGAATTASVTWSSTNPWYNSDGTGDDEHRMSVGYLDDGAPGVSATFTNIPYTNYRVYGLLGSDQGNEYETLDFTVNGVEVFGAATSAPAYGNINTSFAQRGSFWSLADGTNRGNYWTLDTTGSTLTITGFPRNGAQRGSLGAIIIRDLSVPLYDTALKLVVDRDSGQVTLTNNTGADVNFAGLGLLSNSGAWLPGSWTSITTNYDQGGTVSADPWVEFSRSASDLSEGTLGTGTLSQGESISMGNIWSQYFKENTDLRLEYLNSDTGETVNGLLEFTGNDGAPFAIGDFNTDGELNALDWPTVRDNFDSDHAALTAAQSYFLGDFNGDKHTNLNDLLEFKAAFNAANGAGAFEAMVASVPEPGSLALLLIGSVLFCGRRLARVGLNIGVAAALVACFCLASPASAQNGIGLNFRGGQADNDPNATGPDVTGSAGAVFSQPNWNNLGGNFPATDHDATVTGLINSSGANSGASVTWSTNETWSSTGVGPIGSGNPDRDLMDGYLDAISSQPTVTVQLDNIPYAAYDVYVYVGSDGDDRTGRTRINDSITSDRWYRTSTSVAAFTDASSYIAASAKTEATAVAGNYVVYQDVVGPSLLVGNTRGSNNVGLHGIQIVEETNPQVLQLVVNTVTGFASIRNTTAAPINLDFFEITSASSSLDEASWSPLGTGTNDGSNWEVLGNVDDSILAQFFLDGQGTIGAGQSLSLGKAYDGAGQDLEFRYNDPDSFTRFGLVSYELVSVGVDGDYNANGIVDAADYTKWRDNLGQSVTLPNDTTPGTVTNADYAVWKQNFGSTAGAGSVAVGTQSVPEPTSLALVGIAGAAGLLLTSRKRKIGASTLGAYFRSKNLLSLVAALTTTLVALSSMAAVTNDRDYRLGEGTDENGVAGQVVGSGHSIPGAGDTLDGIGPSGAYLDLVQNGGATYVSVTSGPKARPGAPAGGLGVQFDGVDDLLEGVPLNRPDELETILGGYPLNYTGITARGLQGWVYADQAGINKGVYQSVIFDSILSGGPAITPDGKWTQFNSQHADGADGIASIPGTVSVVANTWHHVMHHNYPQGGDDFRSVLYVDGIAVSATDDGIPTGGVSGFVGKLVLGAAEVINDGATPLYANHFQGAIDDLKMYVFGDNTSEGGQNWGTFDLFADNAWIANQIATTVPGGVLKPGDVNRDGSVNGTGTGPVASDDVSAFIAGWRSQKLLQGAHSIVAAGDWETWGWGDMNHDGTVNFSDWYILRGNHPSGASLDLATLVGQQVPEPTSVVLAGAAAILLAAGWARRR